MDSIPVYAFGDGKTWPVVAVAGAGGFVYVCIPFVDTVPPHSGGGQGVAAADAPPVAHLPAVTVGVSLLQELQEVVASTTAEALQESIQQYMGTAMPFGTVLVTSAHVVSKMQTTKLPSKPLTEKQMAWKPEPKSKGRDQLHLVIKEVVRAIQYDSEDVPDVCEVYGHVQCKVRPRCRRAPLLDADARAATRRARRLSDARALRACVALGLFFECGCTFPWRSAASAWCRCSCFLLLLVLLVRVAAGSRRTLTTRQS